MTSNLESNEHSDVESPASASVPASTAETTEGATVGAAPTKTITFADEVVTADNKEKCEEIVKYYDYGYDAENKLEDARCPQTFRENREEASKEQRLTA